MEITNTKKHSTFELNNKNTCKHSVHTHTQTIASKFLNHGKASEERWATKCLQSHLREADHYRGCVCSDHEKTPLT